MRYPSTILATCCVPWAEDGSLEEELFRESIRYLLDHGLRDLYIFGTAGEGYAVSDEMFDEIVHVFAQEMVRHGARPMVGVMSLSLATVIERIERAAALGARAFQISLPAWGALNDRELFTFFREVCARFPECQFLHYNLIRSRRMVTPQEYARLAEEHPNLVATKYAAHDPSMIAGLLHHAGQLQHFLTETGFAYGSLLGSCSLLASIVTSNPQRAREYFNAGVNRDVEKLMTFHQELVRMNEAIGAAVGTGAHMDGAFDKILSKIQQPRFPLRLLPPYEGATTDDFARYLSFLRAHYPQWLAEQPSQESLSA